MYCTVPFHSIQIRVWPVTTCLVSNTSQKEGDRVHLTPACCWFAPLIAFCSMSACQHFQTRAMWCKTSVTYWTNCRSLWHVTFELNEMGQYYQGSFVALTSVLALCASPVIVTHSICNAYFRTKIGLTVVEWCQNGCKSHPKVVIKIQLGLTMYLDQRKQSKSMCRYTHIYSCRQPFMLVFKSTTVQYGVLYEPYHTVTVRSPRCVGEASALPDMSRDISNILSKDQSNT